MRQIENGKIIRRKKLQNNNLFIVLVLKLYMPTLESIKGAREILNTPKEELMNRNYRDNFDHEGYIEPRRILTRRKLEARRAYLEENPLP